MKLIQLVKSISLQSNIEIRKIDEDGNTIDTLWFRGSDGLWASDVDGWKSLNVKYMYSETFTTHYCSGAQTNACMVIEVEAAS